MSSTIQFKDIKPHRGDRRWAFEELSFLLFAEEFRSQGEAVRREGAGGDGGLEGYIHDSEGRVVFGVQAKYFIADTFKPAWWTQMNRSVHVALTANAHHGMMRSYVICTPLTFTEEQRKQWEERSAEWRSEALKLGFPKSPSFEHWGYSKLAHLLLQPTMRGQLSYWFEYPHFHRERCVQLNDATIRGLHERFMPGLHTPTECDDQIHRFLRTERFWREFSEFTSRLMAPVLNGAWPKQKDLPDAIKPSADHFFLKRDELKLLFGDGCHFPDSFRKLRDVGAELSSAAYRLEARYREYLERSPDSEGIKPDKKDKRTIWEQCRHDLGETPSIGGWSHWFDDLRLTPDAQCLLVLGPAGSGKTHTLAEVVTGHQNCGGLVLFAEGGAFTSSDDPWTQFLRWTDFDGGVRRFLDCFSTLAKTTNAHAGGRLLPGLICIDALNETDNRSVWLNRLESFAAELNGYTNLKLVVSCRDDFADLTVPPAIRDEKAYRWRTVYHGGLGASVFDAAPRYLAAYKVRGADVLAMAEEMENPLFLKTFCEAFQNTDVPAGSRSLPAILRAYVSRKSQNIRDRIGCATSQVGDALRELAKTIHNAGHKPVPEADVRALLSQLHTAADEAKSLYRALCSEGFLHEVRDWDELGERTTVRFAYERVWDHLLTLHLLPNDCAQDCAAVSQLRALLSTDAWCRENQNLLGLLAIRLPEEGHGELNDFTAFSPHSAHRVGNAFVGSIRWRTRSSFTTRTEELWAEARKFGRAPLLFSLSLAPLQDHPWNADNLHARLNTIPLGKRDRIWTVALNEAFAGTREVGVPERLIALGENAATHAVSDEQARLLCTALAWICSTTAVAYRHRAACAIARIARARPLVAAALVERFKSVDDPQIVECVLYAAAACAMHSVSGSTDFATLAQSVHTSIFGGLTVRPHILIRHYAQIVCDQAHEKHALPPEIGTASFRPPFRSEWPQIMSDADESALEAGHNQDWKATPALGDVLRSTRTEQTGGYGDWGRYEMGSEVWHFLRTRLDEPREDEDERVRFDDRVARRYVLGRVLSLGLDGTSEDHSDYNDRQRPKIERLGKKYQWIALHEFLGHLTDHYHYHYHDYFSASAQSFRSAVDFSLPDLLDPVLPEVTSTAEREEWNFARSSPIWAPLPTPFPRVLGATERNSVVSAATTDEPSSLLRQDGPQGDWLAVAGDWEWNEPVPCWVNKRSHDYLHARLNWHAVSYAVPIGSINDFVNRMRGPMVGGGMIEQPPSLREELNMLLSYPDKLTGFEEDCATTFSKVLGVWFNTAHFSTRSEGTDAQGGTIPSPQFAKMASLRWIKRGLDFQTAGSSKVEFRNLHEDRHRVTLMDATLLNQLFAAAGLRLVWRLYGWKWCSGSFFNHTPTPQREYWAVYVLGGKGLPECKGGGTWLAQPNAVEEPLPW